MDAQRSRSQTGDKSETRDEPFFFAFAPNLSWVVLAFFESEIRRWGLALTAAAWLIDWLTGLSVGAERGGA